MKAITTWLLIAATILIGLAGLSANAQEFRLKVTTHTDVLKHFGVTPDRRVIGIVCDYSLVRSALTMSNVYSADLVFPNDDGELNFNNYRNSAPSRNLADHKPAYRPLSAEHAKLFCQDPNGEFVFKVTDDGAELLGRRSFSAESFGVGRRQL